MKTPRFEALAKKWQGRASFLFVYSGEAHPKAASSEPLNQFADRLAAMDTDGDHAVSLAEYRGPRFMFDAFDLDGDGVVRSHELLAARRIDQFRGFAAPTSFTERAEAAARFRREVPGEIPLLVDELDDRTAKAFGGLPNSAFVFARGGRLATKMAWADAHAVDVALSELLGAPPSPPPPAPTGPLLGEALGAARRAGRPLLLHFTAPGCPACRTMAGALASPAVSQSLAAVHHVTLSVDEDAAWALFESLGLSATPGFVLFGADGKVRARAQGLQDPAAFQRFLRGS
jgi:thiol-disulfide isomerase/thioredoxin